MAGGGGVVSAGRYRAVRGKLSPNDSRAAYVTGPDLTGRICPVASFWSMEEAESYAANANRREAATRPLLVSWDGAEVKTVPQDRFLAENADDPFVCAAVLALADGQSVTLGGGAAPMVLILALRPGDKTGFEK